MMSSALESELDQSSTSTTLRNYSLGQPVVTELKSPPVVQSESYFKLASTFPSLSLPLSLIEN